MALFLEIVEGPNQGSKYAVKSGVRIGRTQGEIRISDPKISSMHAEIRTNEEGSLILFDLNSSNGLKINGHKVPSIELVPGILFTMGKTLILVSEKTTNVISAENSSTRNTWLDDFKSLVRKANIRNQISTSAVKNFTPPLRVEFLLGPQAEEELFLGFGPRKFGFGSIDCDLRDPTCPELSFEIVPSESGPIIKSADSAVLLNNKIFAEEYLNPEDLIQVGNSVLKVHFIK
jgi:hypothetical protein